MELAYCGFYLNKTQIDYLNLRTEIRLMNNMNFPHVTKLFKVFKFLSENGFKEYDYDLIFDMSEQLLKEINENRFIF